MDRNPPRSLVVEDEEDIREMLREVLKCGGYEVTAVHDGRTALEYVARGAYDLVLLDIGLPDVDGFEVLKTLRRTHPPTELPIIMVTGLGGRDDIVRALKLGANDYVTKPLDMPVVLARLQTQVSLKRAVDQIVTLEKNLERRNSELQNANAELEQTYRQMKQDLQSAAMVQRALLPASLPRIPGVDFTWTCKPCEELAGDSLNVFQLDDDHVGMYLLDVSGHGVRAALLSVTLSRILAPLPDQSCLVRRCVNGSERFEPTPPREVAEELNRRFQLDVRAEQYFTLFYGVLNVRTLELCYVSAGQPGPVYAPRDAAPRDLSMPVFAVGWVVKPDYEERALQLAPGDRVYLYSDGLDEAANGRREHFGKQRIVQAVADCRGIALDESLTRIVEAAETWAQHPFEDDVSALALEITALDEKESPDPVGNSCPGGEA